MVKHHLNTLYVMTQGAYLAKERETVLVKMDGATILRMPIHALEGIVCFGLIGFSPRLLGLCARRGVAVSFLTPNGHFLARAHGYTRGNVLVRREQYRRADQPGRALEIARSIVIAKIINSRGVVLRARRDHASGDEELTRGAEKLKGCAGRAARVDNLDGLRGIEGEAGRTYFGSFNRMILSNEDAFKFVGRSRRPPRDRVNAILSYLYAILGHDVRGACEAAGLDPAVGYLHKDRPGRPGLALDLMEELRAPIVDRLVLTLINRRQIASDDFDEDVGGSVLLKDEARKKVLVAYQERKQEEITHPFLQERTSVGLLMHLQARLLGRLLRDELDAYPAMIWK